MDEYIKREDLLAKLRPDEPGDDRAAVLICDVRRILREFAMMVPAADVVSRGVLEQVMWERDLAIKQLREDYGVSLGEKKSADVVEVKLGRWVGLEYDGYADGLPVYDLWECSECGNEVRGEDVPDTHPWCNGCGARMEGEK